MVALVAGIAPVALAASCGPQWNGSVAGIGAHARSCLDWTTYAYTHFGESWTDAAVDNLGTRNRGGQLCDGVFRWDTDTGWQWAPPGATYHRASASDPILHCTSGHSYHSASNHFFDEAGYNRTPETSHWSS